MPAEPSARLAEIEMNMAWVGKVCRRALIVLAFRYRSWFHKIVFSYLIKMRGKEFERNHCLFKPLNRLTKCFNRGIEMGRLLNLLLSLHRTQFDRLLYRRL